MEFLPAAGSAAFFPLLRQIFQVSSQASTELIWFLKIHHHICEAQKLPGHVRASSQWLHAAKALRGPQHTSMPQGLLHGMRAVDKMQCRMGLGMVRTIFGVVLRV